MGEGGGVVCGKEEREGEGGVSVYLLVGSCRVQLLFIVVVCKFFRRLGVCLGTPPYVV